MEYKGDEITYARGENSSMPLERKVVERLENAGWGVRTAKGYRTEGIDDNVKYKTFWGRTAIENLKTGEQRYYSYSMNEEGGFRCTLTRIWRGEIREHLDVRIEKDETIDGLAYQLPAWRERDL